MKEQGRYFLSDSIRKTMDFSMTDQYMGVDAPPVQKPLPEGALITVLPEPVGLGNIPLEEAIRRREIGRAHD